MTKNTLHNALVSRLFHVESTSGKQTSFLLLMTILMVSFLSSCSMKVRTFDYSNVSKQAVLQTPVITDLDVVNEKKTLEKTYSSINVETARDNAMYDFIVENHCDVIIQPIYSIDAHEKKLLSSDNKYQDVKVRLTGFPATYNNIRKVAPKDTLSFQVYKINGVYQSSAPIVKVNEVNPVKKAGLWLWPVLLVGLLFALR